MTSKDLIALLQEFCRDKAALRDRHAASARVVSGYDNNNAYQYVIAREDVHLSWLHAALQDFGAPVPEAAAPPPAGTARGNDAERSAISEDSRGMREFYERWKPRVEAIDTNARQRRMLSVILGETLEHKRFFDQMLEGRSDVLGRRPAGYSTGGGVLSTRWVE